MITDIFGEDFREFIDCLNQSKVEYLLVGGYSVILHGYNRTTGDLDIWVNPTKENYNRLVAAFRCFQMPLFDMSMEFFLKSDDHDVFTFGRPPVAIDIMTKLKGMDFIKCYSNADLREVGGLQISVIHFKDLQKAKKAANRPKDQDDLDHLK